VIVLMLLFSPWAFGTTQPWSIRVMNLAGYSLGALWMAKLVLRNGFPAQENKVLVHGLLFLTATVLLYILTSAVNASMDYDAATNLFTNREHYIRWLPSSLDPAASWNALAMYSALALTFWATWDWICPSA